MSKEVQALIIGGGVAGSVAASVLASRSVSVCMVDKPGGTTMQSSGGVDVASVTSWEATGPGYIESAKMLAKKSVYHPYSKIGEKALVSMDDALKALMELAKDVGFKLKEDGRNYWLATQIGTLKQSAMVQDSQAFDLCQLDDGDSLLVLGVSGLPGFDARSVSRMLNWSINNVLKKNVFVANDNLVFAPDNGHWRSNMEMALYVDDNQNWETLIREMANVLKSSQTKYRGCLIPAVLGRAHHKEISQRLSELVDIPVYELLASPHSAPGLRLQDALDSGLKKHSIRKIEGEAILAERSNQRISKVLIRENDRVLDIEPENVILACGRFLSGGFERQGLRREKLFGLPLWYEGKMLEQAHVQTLSVNGFTNEQPIFGAGLNVDEKLRPHDRMMELFALNLFAAGSCIGGYDATRSCSGLGVAALTGFMSAFHTVNSISSQ